MKKLSLLLGIASLTALSFLPLKADSEVNFLPGNLTEIQEKAAYEGKLYLVDFVAKWCMPCKWMDETTFSNPQVAQYLSDNYISTKVDIDNFEGYNLKVEYDIQVLPSILIFNSLGKLVGRYEESLPPSKMMTILTSHNLPENRQIISTNQYVEENIANPETEFIAEAPSYTIDLNDKEVEVQEVEVQEVESSVEENPSESSTKMNLDIPDATLFKMTASFQRKTGYAVQVGVFADYGNILNAAAKFQSHFNCEAIVQVSTLKDRQVFKLMLGAFDDIEAAQGLRRLIEENGGEAITKDLAKI